MELKRVFIITDSTVLKEWCAEELRGVATVFHLKTSDDIRNDIKNGRVDALLVDYVPEQESSIAGCYKLFNEMPAEHNWEFIIIYDSFSHSISRLKESYREARFYNLISPAYSLKKLISSSGILEVNSQPSFYTSSCNTGISMHVFEKQLMTAASNDECVLLLGESGSGKSRAAKMIHMYSKRKQEKFCSVNVAEFNPNLIEGNLFGITAGAYTGAVAQKGWFEEADGGTLLMDEIGELPLSLQAKLLSVIENHSCKRLGSTKEYKFNEKLIFATNRDLEECVRNRTFRQDLFYRINCLMLYVPPLRNHSSDIPNLANQFSKELNKTLTNSAIEKLCCYSWPGNIRELKNVVKRACLFSEKETITADDIRFSYYG